MPRIRMSNAANVRVGLRIANLRRAASVTRRKLAKRVGITSQQQLEEYEKGACVVPASHLWEIAIAQDVPLIYYFEDDNQEGDS